MKLDDIDRRILSELQVDASLALETLGERIGLSRNACWRRVKMLESSGIITRRVAILDADAIGRPLTVFIQIRSGRRDQEWVNSLHQKIDTIPEVTGLFRMTGDQDYLMRAQVESLVDYDRLRKELIARLDLSDISANFVMERIKDTTALPV
ncbi:Lrp/AsnC family transcriptional regulator [Pseudoruegeria sp. SK021]|uniref:Lrp/AsnC family transcriptional regulator n=1 Tax=Pseudoruegeria sp. SK021 TaxID=1933035 RepID=UPI000A23ED85|nr:Lrp/AsnC family transcriptional regulator [Pseudoruegeria sp. SK021]OSP55632.1 transcriptional regulator [Pseudoruegeria sp. SK021]